MSSRDPYVVELLRRPVDRRDGVVGQYLGGHLRVSGQRMAACDGEDTRPCCYDGADHEAALTVREPAHHQVDVAAMKGSEDVFEWNLGHLHDALGVPGLEIPDHRHDPPPSERVRRRGSGAADRRVRALSSRGVGDRHQIFDADPAG